MNEREAQTIARAVDRQLLSFEKRIGEKAPPEVADLKASMVLMAGSVAKAMELLKMHEADLREAKRELSEARREIAELKGAPERMVKAIASHLVEFKGQMRSRESVNG